MVQLASTKFCNLWRKTEKERKQNKMVWSQEIKNVCKAFILAMDMDVST